MCTMEVHFISFSKGGIHMLQAIREGDTALIRMEGELDHCCAQSMRRQLDSLLLDPTLRHLVLDFAQLRFMDSSGIGVVLGRYRLLRERGGTLSVQHMNPHVARIFTMSGMGRIIRNLDQQEALK